MTVSGGVGSRTGRGPTLWGGPPETVTVILKIYYMKKNSISPWTWVPTLYFAEGIPYVLVNTVSVIIFKKMGMSNGDVAMFTGLLYLPWVIKPLWSPFVDIIRTKRWWTVSMQLLMTAAMLCGAFFLPSLTPEEISSGNVPVSPFIAALVVFWITAFASATHDIAADGYYMLALNQDQQAFFVGIRSTFYRLATIFGQGFIVFIAGLVESRTGSIPLSWRLTLILSSVTFGLIALYHTFVLPHPLTDRSHMTAGQRSERAKEIFREFGRTFATFFTKRHILLALTFMLLYRLPEAFLVKMLNPFLLDPVSAGGLGLSTEQVGIVYGTIGIMALTLGGILGGMAASKWGLKRVLWPMALSLALPCSVFLYLGIAQPESLWVISACVALDQFGYGFGFTAYMLYLILFSEGEFKTSHYSLCTAFMALSMMLPGMAAGYLQEWIGYVGFFEMVIICCFATVCVTFFVKRTIR